MKLSIVAIGDELLIGQVIDTNSGWIARETAQYGWEIKNVQVVADDKDEIKQAIDRAFKATDVVITTGGLGPTKDDITKQTLCEFFGGELIYDKAVEKNVLEVVAKRGLKINDLTAAQAYVPSSCEVIQNKVGTAPIMWFEKEGKILVSLPGVPFEMQEMMRSAVIPKLKDRLENDTNIEHHTFIIIDHSESVLAGKLEKFENELPEFVHMAYLPQPGLIRIRLTARHKDKSLIDSKMEELTEQLKAILDKSIICFEDKTPAEILGQLLKEKGLTISTAESCTGGNIAHQITQVAGSSEYYKGSVVSYANEVKETVLNVDKNILNKEGAVSEPVVRMMAEGVAKLLNTDCSISTSGIAGPGGGSKEKPIGTVWMAITCQGETLSKVCHFAGNRDRVINHTTMISLIYLIKKLAK